nr:MAG TPA: hypothetical protein [Caudoviricetes sp.]
MAKSTDFRVSIIVYNGCPLKKRLRRTERGEL